MPTSYSFKVLSFFSLLLCLGISCTTPEQNDRLAAEDFCKNIHRNDSLSLSSELAAFTDLMVDKTGVYVLEDGAGSLVMRGWLTEYAEKTIDIQYFIFSTDNVGLIACDYLVRAADRGVKVRILVDDIMVDADLDEVLVLDAHDNIDIKIYNPGVNLGKSIYAKIHKLTTDFRSANQRMHNKVFMVDQKIVITGGRNVADEYFDYDHEYNFRDRDVLLLGKAVAQVDQSFNTFWQDTLSVDVAALADKGYQPNSDPQRYEALHQYACNPDNFWPQVRSQLAGLPMAFRQIQEAGGIAWVDRVDFVSDVPGKNDGQDGLGGGGASTDALIALVKNAKRSIDIQSPYLITTEESRKLFADAVARGVKIRILTNSLASTDNVEAFSGYRRDRADLLATGVRIFEFRPDAAERRKIMTSALQETIDYAPIFGLHAKSMVIDGEIVVIGTFNLDPRSANLNTECITIIYDNTITAGVLAGMEQEFKPENSWETTSTSNPDEFAGRTKNIKTWTRKAIPKGIL